MKNFKIETFLILSLANAILYKIIPSHLLKLTLLVIIAVCIFFISNNKKFILSLLLLHLFFNYTPIHLDIVVDTFSNYSKGILKNYDKKYSPGTLLLYTTTKKYKTIIPIVTDLLFFRHKISKELYLKSAGTVTLTQAISYGIKRYIPNELSDIFIITGTTHLLAISGLHVGLFITLIFFIFNFLPPKMKYLIVTFILLFFTILTGFKITVIRASLFAIIIFIALFLDTKVNLKKLLFIVASCFIFIFPNIVTDISFILSFSAVTGILYVIKSDKNKIKSFFYVSLGATVFTLPFILYFFGSFNYLGILNTLLILPFIYIELIFGLFYPIFGDILINPLIKIELLLNSFLYFLYKFTYSFFVLNRISTFLLILSLIFLIIFILTKKYILLIAIIILPFANFSYKSITVFPNMKRSKGFISIEQNTQIFFKGFHSDFKYKFLPLIAKFGRKNFDYGIIKIYDGTNLFIKINKTELKNICLNKLAPSCSFAYFTRANSIKNKMLESYKKPIIIYKNYLKSDNIYELYNKKCIILSKGGLIVEDESICK